MALRAGAKPGRLPWSRQSQILEVGPPTPSLSWESSSILGWEARRPTNDDTTDTGGDERARRSELSPNLYKTILILYDLWYGHYCDQRSPRAPL
jgi:hypothetical protein